MRVSPALLLLLPLALGGCFERAQATVEQPVRPVLAVRVQAAQDAAPRHYPGLVKPRREADIGFRAGGRIVAREVDVGARVVAGQVMRGWMTAILHWACAVPRRIWPARRRRRR